MLVSFNTNKGHRWSVVWDVLLSCIMSTFHQQLSMYNNEVPREQCVAEIVSDHVDHIHFRRAATGAH